MGEWDDVGEPGHFFKFIYASRADRMIESVNDIGLAHKFKQNLS